MASKFVERCKKAERVWQTTDIQTDRPRYAEMCSYRQNRLRWSDSA